MALYGIDRALYKEAHGSVGSPWHQDAAFHGKYSRHDSVVFWVPLHDVDTENGCMQYIPLERNQAVLPHRPFFTNDPLSLMTDHVDGSKAVNCPLTAGGAMIHGALTLHTAHVNRSASTRRVWTLTFRPWGRLGGVAPARLLHVARVVSTDLLAHAGYSQHGD
jgi:ectoine hydroxylase-related dioxygenase (phytanoyl-CoA dioxygenase family)